MFWTREKDLQAVRKQKKKAKFNLIVCHCQFSFQKNLVFLTRTSRNLCGKSKLDKQNPTRSPRFFFLFLAGQHCFPNWKHKMFSWRRNNKRTTETATCVCFTNHTSSNGFLVLILLFFFKRKRWQWFCLQKRVALTPLRSLTPSMDTRELSVDTGRDFGTFD